MELATNTEKFTL